MITEITMNGVASYKQPTTLHTEKLVNLIYGLNGTGKSTLSEFLRHSEDAFYEHCSLNPKINEDEEEILVYNDKYVQDVFYEKDTLNGIFSLSKENADAYRKIEDAQKKLQTQQDMRSALNEEKTKKDDEANENKCALDEAIWEIKKTYTGGDRVLRFCLEGHMGSKSDLSDYVRRLPKPDADLPESIENLKSEMTILNNSEGLQPIPELPLYSYRSLNDADSKLLQDVITGDRKSRVAALIDQLNTSDWVKRGLEYDSPDVCPFCQRPYKDDSILRDLKDFFNEDYKKSVSRIEEIYQFVKSQKDTLISLEPKYDEIECIKSLKPKYNSAFTKYKAAIDKVVDILSEKVHNPGESVNLPDVYPLLHELNKIIEASNEQITIFNHKVATIQEQRAMIKNKFWKKMRWQYDSAIATYDRQEKAYNTYLETNYNIKNQEINRNIETHTKIIQEESQKIVNITDAIANIDAMLTDMGITDFKIEKSNVEEGFYRIARESDEEFVFKTLSEGEKVIISFLYFLESCRGLQSKTDTKKKRIIVIDDPISSLSHMYTYNVGRLIWRICYPSIKKSRNDCSLLEQPFEQVFVLTHSLYFFYELIELDSDKRHFYQNLFRLKKTKDGSQIEEMHYNDIQNEYQEYWSIINNPQEHPALIANCMRNVLEYFFGFVEGKELSAIFSCEAMKNPKYQAFNRFINRESHSIPINLSDFKEFDYTLFMEALSMIFQDNGYERHFNTMRKSSLS